MSKPEKNVQAHKTRTEQPIGRAMGERGNNIYIKGNLHGMGKALTPYQHLITPDGGDEKGTIDPDGS